MGKQGPGLGTLSSSTLTHCDLALALLDPQVQMRGCDWISLADSSIFRSQAGVVGEAGLVGGGGLAGQGTHVGKLEFPGFIEGH